MLVLLHYSVVINQRALCFLKNSFNHKLSILFFNVFMYYIYAFFQSDLNWFWDNIWSVHTFFGNQTCDLLNLILEVFYNAAVCVLDICGKNLNWLTVQIQPLKQCFPETRVKQDIKRHYILIMPHERRMCYPSNYEN